MVQFLFVSAIVPSMLLIWFFHSRDIYPEPQRVVWATFGLGVLIVIPVLICELTIMAGIKHIANPFLSGTVEGFFCAGLVEEFFKYLVLTRYCMRHKEFDEPMDGIVYGAIASLGFATLENILYVGSGGAGSAIMRAISAVPCHASMGAIMGYFVGQAKFTPQKRTSLMTLAFFVPMFLHGCYDAPLLVAGHLSAMKPIPENQAEIAGLFMLVTLITLLGEIICAIRLSGRLRRQQLAWHAARWAAWRAGYPPPPPPWYQNMPTAPTWAYAPGVQPFAQMQNAQPQNAQFQSAPQHAPFQNAQPQYAQSQNRQQPYAQGQYVQNAQYPGAFAAGAAYPSGAQPTTGSSVISALLLAAGVIFASVGGLMMLGAIVAFFAALGNHEAATTEGGLLIVGVVFGILPLVLGLGMFIYAMKRLVATSPPPPPRAYAAYG